MSGTEDKAKKTAVTEKPAKKAASKPEIEVSAQEDAEAQVEASDDLPKLNVDPEKKPFTAKLNNARFKGVDFVRNNFAVTPEKETPIQSLLQPEYWANVAKSLKIGDRIECMPDAMTYYAELIVMEVGSTFAKVALIRHVKLHAVDNRDELKGLKVEYAGRVQLYRVVRGGYVIREGFANKTAAMKFAMAYAEEIAA